MYFENNIIMNSKKIYHNYKYGYESIVKNGKRKTISQIFEKFGSTELYYHIIEDYEKKYIQILYLKLLIKFYIIFQG